MPLHNSPQYPYISLPFHGVVGGRQSEQSRILRPLSEDGKRTCASAVSVAFQEVPSGSVVFCARAAVVVCCAERVGNALTFERFVRVGGAACWDTGVVAVLQGVLVIFISKDDFSKGRIDWIYCLVMVRVPHIQAVLKLVQEEVHVFQTDKIVAFVEIPHALLVIVPTVACPVQFAPATGILDTVDEVGCPIKKVTADEERFGCCRRLDETSEKRVTIVTGEQLHPFLAICHQYRKHALNVQLLLYLRR